MAEPPFVVLPDTLAVLPHPLRFQIGPDHHQYVYSATDATWEGFPVYRCSRSRDNLPGCLYLLQSDGHWQACLVTGDAPTSAEEIIARMAPAFRTADGDDVRLEGDHLWECWDDQTNRWWPPSSFRARLLP